MLAPWVMLVLMGQLSLGGGSQASHPVDRIVFGPQDTERCLKCHGMSNFAFRDSATMSVHDYTINRDIFKTSIHGKLACQQCHQDIKEYPHKIEDTRVRVSCGADCHASDSSGKEYLHLTVFNEFQQSVHRQGLSNDRQDNPGCTTCHGSGNPHGIAKAVKIMSAREKMDLCIGCHDDISMMAKHKVDPEAVSSYKRSFHYKAIRFGQTNTAVCQDCHTTHHILPKDSAASSIAAGHIAQTCGQENCHHGAAINFAMSGANHLALRIEREPVLWYLEKFFIVLTLGTMIMLFVGITLDIQRKYRWVFVLRGMYRRARASLRIAMHLLARIMKFSRRILFD